MIVGCYSLDLYCDCKNPAHGHGEFPHLYTAEFGSTCRKEAKRDGWKLRGSIAICPKCAKAGIKPPESPDEIKDLNIRSE